MPIDNLAQANAEIEKLWKRLERLERAAPLGFSSISRGSLRITSPEGLIVEGSARVSGTLNMSGTENVTGTLNVSGTENVTGALGVTGTTTLAGPLIVNGTANITGPNTSITGPLHVAGNQDNTGTLAVKGAATLENDLTVTGSGKILVGSMTISTQAGGYGQLQSPTTVYLNAPFVVASGVFTALGNVNVSGALANSGIALKAGAVNNLHVDAAGRIWRTS